MRRKGEAPQGLYLRGEKWHADKIVRVGTERQRIREATGFARSELDKAVAWLRRRVSEVEREILYGPPPETAKPSVTGFATAAADYAEKGGKRGPLGKQDLAKLTTLAEFFGEKPCDEIDEADWDDFVGACLATRKVSVIRGGKEIGKRAVPAAGPDTERRWFSMFRAPMRRALRRHGIALRDFDIPPASAGRTPPFLHRESEAALLAAYGERTRTIAELLAWQGCREMEALRLHLPGDVDFRAHTLIFRETKNGAPRTVPMDSRVAASLRRHLTRADGSPRRIGPVFLTPAGEAYNDRRAASHGQGLDGGGIRTAHRYACQRAGISGFRIHDWRHHFAVWFLINGGKETELMALCGWKDRRMIDRYVALPLDHLRKTLVYSTTTPQEAAGDA